MTHQPGQDTQHDPTQCAKRLVRLMEQQVGLLEQIESLSGGQRELIAAGKSDDLLRVIAQRQVLVDQVAELTEQITPLRELWNTTSGQVDAQLRQQVEQVVGRITGAIDNISKNDEADRAALEQQRKDVFGSLGTVTRARGAVAAYSSSGGTQHNAFQDRQG